MNSNERTHPIEIALAAALVILDAVVIVASALVALVLAARSRKPSASPTKPAPQSPAAPFSHPLFTLAHDLRSLTCRELRELAGTRQNLPKQKLIELVAVGV